jgi:hypothetical protein
MKKRRPDSAMRESGWASEVTDIKIYIHHEGHEDHEVNMKFLDVILS